MSSEEGPVAWLRKQIEADMAAAKIISDGGFSPERWDTEPPGQVNPVDIPQNDAVTAALGCAPEYICGWVQLVAYGKLNNEADEAYCRDSEAPFALVDNGRREFDHIIRHDPRNVVADCEAKLAILDEHYILTSGDRNPDYEEFSVVPWGAKGGAGDRGSGCVTCHYYGMGGVKGYGVCRTVRSLASAYKHRPGYREVWTLGIDSQLLVDPYRQQSVSTQPRDRLLEGVGLLLGVDGQATHP